MNKKHPTANQVRKRTVRRVEQERFTIIVEGPIDQKIAQAFLSVAGIPLDRLEFIVAGGINKIGHVIRSISSDREAGKIAVLVDLDLDNNFEAEAIARLKLKLVESEINVFTAIPTIESWLFADIEIVRKMSKNKKLVDQVLSRIPLPDDIPYPRHLASRLFKLNEEFELVYDDVNINVATSRSPSLRKFILGISHLLGVDSSVKWEKEFSRTVGRDVFSKLVDEVTPPDIVIYRTLDGDEITAKEMSVHIKEGTDVGMNYSTDVLRIARDLLARNSRKLQK